jgi:hypothetical protein
MPHYPSRGIGVLTFEELTVLDTSGAAVPDGEVVDFLLSSVLVVAIMNTSGLCQFVLESVTPGLHPGIPHRKPLSTWGKSTTMCERRARGSSLGLIRANPSRARFVTLASAPVVI